MNDSSDFMKIQIMIYIPMFHIPIHLGKSFCYKGTNKQILTNVMTNIISHETNIFSDWESPWINNKVKTTIQEKIISILFEK